MTGWGIAFAILGFIALFIGAAVYLAIRYPDLLAQRRADKRSFLRQQSISRRRPMLVPLEPNERCTLRVVPTPAPRDKR
jgi:hypothetical protein